MFCSQIVFPLINGVFHFVPQFMAVVAYCRVVLLFYSHLVNAADSVGDYIQFACLLQ